ncbi:hypothetical protein FE633_13480 [Streptomyces montanus]|uniref:Uncharacterized protein n=1 Tax=Streptomyces montanus TaxID=2580423 RepID=A0A5R9FWN0_9ACTN|nr:hypothetical protein [Streptomyces montanus]TLS45768.1 hypothetical protein FE633_13480 [Streptomyces montanus]
MTSFTPSRSRRLAAAASALTAIAIAVGVLVLALGASLPEAWWPRTGQAFATESSSAREDPCGLIVGPAKAYCERDTTTTASAPAEHPADVAGAAWTLVPAGTGLAALVMWRRRGAARQGRR